MLQKYETDSLQPIKNQEKYFYIYLCICNIGYFKGCPGHADLTAGALPVK